MIQKCWKKQMNVSVRMCGSSGSNKKLRLWRSSTWDRRREMKVKKSRSRKEDEDVRWYLPLDTLLNLYGKHWIYLKWNITYLMKYIYKENIHPNAEILLYRVRFAENLNVIHLLIKQNTKQKGLQATLRSFLEYCVLNKIRQEIISLTLPAKSLESFFFLKKSYNNHTTYSKNCRTTATKFNLHFFHTRFMGHVL